MTLNEAENLYYLKNSIDAIKMVLDEMDIEHKKEIGVKPIKYDGMPHGTSVSDPMRMSDKYLDDIRKTKRRLEEMKVRRVGLLLKYTEEVETIEDTEMKSIIEYRCLSGLDWNCIGKKMNMHRTTVSKKYYKFFRKDSHNSH